MYTLLANDHEDLHAIFIELHIIYKRAAKECVWAHDNRIDSPGHTFQKWKPWLEPTYPESAVWQQRNSISLSAVVEAFKFDKVKRVQNGVFHLGDRRTGSKTDSATSSHTYACQFLILAVTAVFRGELAKFSSCLKLNFPHLSANWTQRFRRDIFSRRSRSLTTADYAQRASCACCV